MTMTFEQAKKIRDSLELDLKGPSDRLATCPRGPLGMVPDSVRELPEYKADRRAFELAFAKLRAFNAKFVKQFAKELAAERKLKYKQ